MRSTKFTGHYPSTVRNTVTQRPVETKPGHRNQYRPTVNRSFQDLLTTNTPANKVDRQFKGVSNQITGEPSFSVRLLGSFSRDLDKNRLSIDHVVQRAAAGESFTPSQMLAMQAQVYAYSQQIDLTSRVVEKSLSAIKTVLNTNV